MIRERTKPVLSEEGPAPTIDEALQQHRCSYNGSRDVSVLVGVLVEAVDDLSARLDRIEVGR